MKDQKQNRIKTVALTQDPVPTPTRPGYALDSWHYTPEAADVTRNEVRILVTPKAVGGETPSTFFFKGASY